MKYRIKNSRHDVKTEVAHTFDADNDEAAMAVLTKFAKKKNYSWDDLDLIRVDRPAVAEKITAIGCMQRQGVEKERLLRYPAKA